MAGTLVDVQLLAPTDAAGKVKFKDQPFGIVCGTTRGGTYIRKVVAGSPAEGAGVRVNDVVVAYSGDKDFLARFATKAAEFYAAGKTFYVRLRRPAPKGRPKTASPAPDPLEDSRLVEDSRVARSLTPTERKRQQRQRDSDEKRAKDKEKVRDLNKASRRTATPEHRRHESLRSRERRSLFTEKDWEAEKERQQAARDAMTDKEKEARRKSDRLRQTGVTGWEGLTARLSGKEAQKARTQAERIAELTEEAAAASPHIADHLDSHRQPVFKQPRIMYLEGRDPADLTTYQGFHPLRPDGEALAPPGDAADPRPELTYDRQGALESIWVSGLEGEYHEELLNPPQALNIGIVNQAMDLMRDFVERNRGQPHYRAWAELEILPTAPFSMMGRGQNPAPGPPPLRPMDRLPPLPPAAQMVCSHFRSVCVVYIGDGGMGHFVVLLTNGRSKEVKVFDSYSSITRTDNAELRHLAAVGATMLRLRSSEGIELTFPKVPEQDHSLNSCGAFALLLATAVVMGVRMDWLNVTNEVLLRRRVHDFIWCQQANGDPELTALLFALEDCGAPPLVRTESGFATRCAHCDDLPLNYGNDGQPELQLDAQGRHDLLCGTDAQPPVLGPHPPDQPSDPGLPMDTSDSSEDDEDPLLTARELAPPSAKRNGRGAVARAPPKVSAGKSKKPEEEWKYEELEELKRPGVPEEEANRCGWCSAFLFADEAGSPTAVTKEWCCGKGRFVVPPLQPYTFPLYDEGRYVDPRFNTHARTLNNMFTFAAGGVSGKWLSMPGGTSMVRAEGKIYRRLYDLSYRNQRGQRTNQLCILDPAFRQTEAASMKVALDVMNQVSQFLFASNKLYEEYKRLDSLAGIPSARVVFKTVTRATHGNVLGDAARGPQQNLFPTADEVSAIIVTDDDAQPREVSVWKQGQASSTLIYHLDPKYEALAFPLLRPFAEAAWHPGFRSTTGERLTHLQYQKQLFLTQPRMWELDRLGQEAVLDAVSRIQESRLNWVRTHQADLRTGSRAEITARLGEEGDTPDPGRRIVLPATFTGSPRYMRGLYEDAMAIVNRYGKPTFFLTVTTNPNWPELNPDAKKKAEEDGKRGSRGKAAPKRDSRGRLPRKSRPSKGPGLIARVFELKLRRLLRDIRSGKLFDSKTHYCISTVEHQKRGLPHAHILFKLKKNLPVAEMGTYIKTHIPGEDEPELREQVLKHQIHGPCSGSSFITYCPCLDQRTKRCTKNYPKPANEAPHTDERGYPHYRRTRDEKATVRKAQKDMEVDDRWVVPYSDRILRMYDCHNNLEYASSGLTCKYLFKYTTKGPSKALVTVAEEGARVDECQDYENRRVMGAAEAHSRIYSFDVHSRTPSVRPISVHLPDDDNITHKTGNLQGALKKTSQLTRYLNRPDGPIFDPVRFHEYCEVFVEKLKPTKDPKTKKITSIPHPDGIHHITPRKKGEMVARIYWVGPGRAEQFYLRMLVARFAARSFEELRTVKGTVYGTFQEAAQAHGLCQDDKEYMEAMTEAAGFLTGPSLRQLFVTMACGAAEALPKMLWETCSETFLSEDFRHRGMTMAAAKNEALIHISHLLEGHGKSLRQMGLPECEDRSTEVGREVTRWDRAAQRAFVDLWTPRLNGQQRRVVDTLLAEMPDRLALKVHWPPLPTKEILALPPQSASQRCRPASTAGPKYFFLLAPGGSGKTVTLNFITALLRSKGHIVLCTATTGIASLNFPGGLTAHGMFKLPIETEDPDAISFLSMRSQRAELIRKASVIIVDEAPNLQRNSIRTLERVIQDVAPPNLRFVVYVGDLQQIPPVIKWGSKADILHASIRFDPRWDQYQKLHLTKNERAAGDPDYAAWAAKIGNGTAPTALLPGIPFPLTKLSLIQPVQSRDDLISFVYPSLGDPYQCSQRAILAGTNVQIDSLNEEVLERLPGPMEVFYSADACDGKMTVESEVLATLSDVGVPPHRLQLKVGAVAIVVRNINFAQGLCNSTKVIIREILPSRRLIMVEIPKDGGPGEVVPVPRITFKFSPGGHGMEVTRKQFPLRAAYSLTHNKSQGQTLKRVGLDLTEDVFAHGQLYVDVTRVEHRDSIRVLAPPARVVDGVAHVLNVVYPELINAEPVGPRAEEGVDRPPPPELGPDNAAAPADDDDGEMEF